MTDAAMVIALAALTYLTLVMLGYGGGRPRLPGRRAFRAELRDTRDVAARAKDDPR